MLGDLDAASVLAPLGSCWTGRQWLISDGMTPAGDDAVPLATVASTLAHLGRSFTPADAVVAWFILGPIRNSTDGCLRACSRTWP